MRYLASNALSLGLLLGPQVPGGFDGDTPALVAFGITLLVVGLMIALAIGLRASAPPTALPGLVFLGAVVVAWSERRVATVARL